MTATIGRHDVQKRVRIARQAYGASNLTLLFPRGTTTVYRYLALSMYCFQRVVMISMSNC
jgi:hypothetical protein